MKALKLYFVIFIFGISNVAIAQVQIDKKISLTGASSDASLNGIKQVTDSSSAVNAGTIQRDSLIFALDNSTIPNLFTISLSPPVSAYSTGMLVHFKANTGNTGAATLSVNGLAASPIKKNFNADLAASDIKSGQIVSAIYDGINFQMLSQTGNSSGATVSTGKQAFYYTGGNQYFTIPAGVTSLNVKLWGGGGGAAPGQGSGGGGAFVSGTLTVTPGQLLTIIAGRGGNGFGVTYGGGGAGGVLGANGNTTSVGGSGGGRSAIQLVAGTDAVTAGAGGGAGISVNGVEWGNGGGGGATTGGNGTTGGSAGNGSSCNNEAGIGATVTGGGAGGSSAVCSGVSGSASLNGGTGSQYAGGNSAANTGGGGGGGYFGGGAGGSKYGGGGGGGSSYYLTTGGFTLTSNTAGASIAGNHAGPAVAGGNTDADYQPGIGLGAYDYGMFSAYNALSQGGNGMVVISW